MNAPAAAGEEAAPRTAYQARLAERTRAAARHARRERTISRLRLVVFVLGVIAAWLAFARETLPPAAVAVPVTVFVGLVLWHDAVIRARQRAERAAETYRAGLARLDHAWAGTGRSGEAYRNPAHPYADDLDLFGRGSLFERVCAARTREGEARLAGWLCAPAEPGTVRARQGAVQELRPALDLREDLALLGEDLRDAVHGTAIADWADAPATAFPRGVRVLAAALSAAALATLAAWILGAAGPLPFVAALLAEVALWASLRVRLATVTHRVESPARELRLLSQVLERIEQERFRSPRLAALRAALDTDGEPPSREIARLRRLIELLDARRNQLFAPLAGLLLWSVQLGIAIEGWRVRTGPSIGRWLEALAEIEALSSLARYAFERPDDPFPEIAEDAPCFEGQGLGHPLIPDARCVRNDVSLSAERALLVVSGSNMSGKSTLLRTVGVNAALALAGAPVCASRLRVSPLAVGATLRVFDSLQEGASHFYAELVRIRDIVRRAESEPPVLFLMDEIFHGTNSHDRRIGAEAVVRALLARGAVGMVTTHDLALAAVAEALAPRAANVHFEDQLVDGEIRFDYRMRPGVVERSNALELMRAVGLEVENA